MNWLTDRHIPTLPGWLVTTLRWFITLALPVLLILTSVRLVMTEAFVWIEYNRPGFPADRYGFTKEERLDYAPYAVEYLHNNADISYLGDLTFPNGTPLFYQKELDHMEDVKVVTRAAFAVQNILGVLFLAVVAALAWRRETRGALRRGLSGGGTFTIGLIVTLVVLLLANWDYFFDSFHMIFFEGASWLFRTSDTLIRLFPNQFWLDASL
ncbi:MAG: TIGR01906 family membrane protein, partial [Anaerolineae bacterium]|nr:TIGR01906 family membrane protein [Anaerolineae bacterium]